MCLSLLLDLKARFRVYAGARTANKTSSRIEIVTIYYHLIS
jgi:hypothetical protein